MAERTEVPRVGITLPSVGEAGSTFTGIRKHSSPVLSDSKTSAMIHYAVLSCDQKVGESLGAGEFSGCSAPCIIKREPIPQSKVWCFSFSGYSFFFIHQSFTPLGVRAM